ncbi:MAG: hypothetical protein C0593_00200 [Marinilabiliales bacterium]|nr:MAG: hypothetical protein C0593_00200 [Marinilabiliales bacterium]
MKYEQINFDNARCLSAAEGTGKTAEGTGKAARHEKYINIPNPPHLPERISSTFQRTIRGDHRWHHPIPCTH